LGSKPPSPLVQQEENQQTEIQTTLPAISHEYLTNQPPAHKSTIPRRARPPTHLNMNRWNTSTRAKQNPYVPDLPDAYPRDPFTKMPPKRDATEVYRLLQSIYYILKTLISYLC
jgi:hypothetical protein